MTVFGTQPEMRFGTALAVVRNAEVDGRTVIAVGMPRCSYGKPKPSDAGAVAFFAWENGAAAFVSLGMLESPNAHAILGQSLANVGDVDGDGSSDLLIGAPNYRAPHPFEGAWILNTEPMPWLSIKRQIVTPSGVRGTRLGLSVARAGDVNGDGRMDLIIGAPRQHGVNMRRGTVFVHHGTTNGVEAAPAWSVHGESSEDLFGRAVAAAGDVNGDGFADVLVGAPRFSGSEADVGRVYLYVGSPKGLQRTPAWTNDGPAPMSWMGDALESLGDINGDGFDDVVLGAPGPDQYASSWPGAVCIYLGSSNGLAATPAMVLRGTFPGSLFGAALGTRGDVNGDRRPDLLIGAPKFSEGQPSAGRIYLFLGRPGGVSSHSSWVLDGGQPNGLCGSALTFVPDLNHDGCDEILVSSPRYTTVQRREGRVDLLIGSSTKYVSTNLVAADKAPGETLASTGETQPAARLLVYGIGGGLAALLLVGTFVWQRRRHESTLGVEAERKRLARDLHDDLGARLTRISVLTELVRREATSSDEGRRNAQLLAETAREVLESMEQVIWSVNPANDTLENLVVFIVQYAGPFLAPSGIELLSESPDALPARPLPANLRKSVFLSVKETLNNVVKHAGATQVGLRIRYEASALTIVIEDNGRGLRAQAGGESDIAAVGSDGLKNMRERMREAGGTFTVEAGPGGGTRVTLRVRV